MQTSTPPNSTRVSPKRKRLPDLLGDEHRPSRLRIATLPAPSHTESDPDGGSSPRSVITVHFQNLGLAEHSPISGVDFRKALQGSMAALQTNSTKKAVNNGNGIATHPQQTVPMDTVEPIITSELDMRDSNVAKFSPTLEIPETPQLKPIVSLSSPPVPIVSPSGISSTLWWKPTEITGHDPTDPNDDGYGINGVGFLPTPAVARARIELRRRQVAAWRAREAKEARQRRSDRRRHRNIGFSGDGTMLAGLSKGEVKKVKQVRKVRFVGE
jgi:hypothetical protein